jgi:hypothetical protein
MTEEEAYKAFREHILEADRLWNAKTPTLLSGIPGDYDMAYRDWEREAIRQGGLVQAMAGAILTKR